jgi:multidrug resistance efflux pump
VVVEPEDVAERFVGYGTAQPDRVANLAAEVAATVVELVGDIEAGSAVRREQLLIRLDDREYRYALARAEALAASDQAAIDELDTEAQSLAGLIRTAEQELRVASEEKARVSGLFETGHAAKKEYDFANLAYQQARRVLQGFQMEASKLGPRRARAVASKRSRLAEAELAVLNVERCDIRAPFAGTIESLLIEVGDRAAPGVVLVRLLDPAHVEIPIQLPAGVYDRLEVGARCRVMSESMPGSGWDGQVARIAPSVDSQSRTFAVYVDVDNAVQEHSLVPGTFVRAEVHGPTHLGRLLVPRGAIVAGHVLVARQGIAFERAVTVERLIEDRALVAGGLRPYDRVILSHLDRLSDGSPVRIEGTANRE